MSHRTSILNGIRTFGSRLTLWGSRTLSAIRRRIVWLRWLRKASRIYWTMNRMRECGQFKVSAIIIPEDETKPLFGPGETGEE